MNNDEIDTNKPTDVYTVSYDYAESLGADYITQSELEQMGFDIDEDTEVKDG